MHHFVLARPHPIDDLRNVYHGLPTAGDYGVATLKAVIFLAFIGLGWLTVNLLTTKLDDHVEMTRNGAFVTIRTGMLFGSVLAIYPPLNARSNDTASDLWWLLGGAVYIIVVFNLIRPILDTLLYGRPQNANQLRKASLASAIIQAAFYLACGWVINGSFSGSAPSLSTSIKAIGAFTLMGFATLFGAYLLIGRMHGMAKRVRLSRTSNNPNDGTAAALILGAIIIGLGLMLHTAIAGDFTGWESGIIGFLVSIGVGIPVLVIVVRFVDRFILGLTDIKTLVSNDERLPAIIMAVGILAVATGFSAIVI